MSPFERQGEGFNPRPTRVGNTSRHNWKHYEHQVHPHACGEYMCYIHYRSRLTWSTPTRVGNTLYRMFRSALYLLHPHACGEYAG